MSLSTSQIPIEEILNNNNNNNNNHINNSTKSFQILNSSDNLIAQFGKPNAIVRPVRRRVPFNGSDDVGGFSRYGGFGGSGNSVGGGGENGTTNYASDDRSQFTGIFHDRKENDHNNIESQILSNHNNNKLLKSDNELGCFTKELDLKLRLLQKDKKGSSKNSSNGETIQKRPLFISTVPTGIFLQPTRDLPIPPPRRTYAFFSIPKIYANKENNYGVSGYRMAQSQQQLQQNQQQSHIAQLNNQPSSTSSLLQPLMHLKTNSFKLNRLREPHTQNIMYDKRVVRGSNYSQNHMNMWNPNFAYAGLLSGKGGDGDTSKEDEVQRRQLLRKRFATQRTRRSVIGTPPPIRGRKHEEIQTEQYLEELHCRPAEVHVQCQTDLFLHRPPTPPYVPAKMGVDADTEILDGELFNFDTEVQPLIDTLVGRTIEQSLIEVVHEEEIADMKRQQQEFLAIRETEEAELRRLEAEEIRLHAEKERRLRQEAIAREVDKDVQERVTAAKLLQGHIAQLLPSVLNKIEPYVQAENRDVLEKSLGPWLANEVAEEVGQMIDSRDLLEEIVREILEERAGRYIKMAENANHESLTQKKNKNTDAVENIIEKNVEEMMNVEDESSIVLTQNQNENNNAGTKL